MLSEKEIQDKLKTVKGWERMGNAIEKKFKFKDFVEATAFLVKVGFAAESMDHHPDITWSYSRVTLSLTTHSANGLTQKDFDLAQKIDQIG
ncbi:MAG: 4a-hydroxytetrahydrobiopterin dehydratase [Elusimicrobia bacterium]|nr:4a-hydroxytetrahydrobiopterin dehydratase [Elusimicrobiota bacterium]